MNWPHAVKYIYYSGIAANLIVSGVKYAQSKDRLVGRFLLVAGAYGLLEAGGWFCTEHHINNAWWYNNLYPLLFGALALLMAEAPEFGAKWKALIIGSIPVFALISSLSYWVFLEYENLNTGIFQFSNFLLASMAIGWLMQRMRSIGNEPILRSSFLALSVGMLLNTVLMMFMYLTFTHFVHLAPNAPAAMANYMVINSINFLFQLALIWAGSLHLTSTQK